MSKLERCCVCDQPTGRAGRHDDSLYLYSGEGPFCEDCYANARSDDIVAWLREQDEMGFHEAADEIERLRSWVADLQSGMYINCVYCGHRYGPADKVPATMADALKAHIEKCPAHPMSALKSEIDRLRRELAARDVDPTEACGYVNLYVHSHYDTGEYLEYEEVGIYHKYGCTKRLLSTLDDASNLREQIEEWIQRHWPECSEEVIRVAVGYEDDTWIAEMIRVLKLRASWPRESRRRSHDQPHRD